MIIAKGIEKSYGELNVLKGIDLHIAKGEIVSITGKSGAGKSTLLHILGTLESADKGKIIINNQDVISLEGKKLSNFRNNTLGFVFQFHHLLPEFSAIENICIPALIRGEKESIAIEKAKHLLDILGLSERIGHKPNELSGGEQQRVAMARALINEPAVIFADEPTGNLDTASSNELHELIFNLRDKLGQTFLIVTHNTELAQMSDRQIIMIDGLIS